MTIGNGVSLAYSAEPEYRPASTNDHYLAAEVSRCLKTSSVTSSKGKTVPNLLRNSITPKNHFVDPLSSWSLSMLMSDHSAVLDRNLRKATHGRRLV